jgi:hypothetical protein
MQIDPSQAERKPEAIILVHTGIVIVHTEKNIVQSILVKVWTNYCGLARCGSDKGQVSFFHCIIQRIST